MEKQIQDALSTIFSFLKEPIRSIQSYYEKNGIAGDTFPLIVNEDFIRNAILEINEVTKSSIDKLTDRLDNLNASFVKEFSKKIEEDSDIDYLFKPIHRIGIFVPYKLPSSAYTFLSAAKAAGVKEISVYLAFGKEDKKIDSASIYAASKYGAQILCGPAIYGFPVLSLGIDGFFCRCDKIFGPCGRFLNTIKQLSSLIAGCDSDMSAGPSDLTIITDNEKYFHQIELDLLSQLEHGPDSKAFLLLINQKYNGNNKEVAINIKEGKIHVFDMPNWVTGLKKINELAPETVVVYSNSQENIKLAQEEIISAGVCYFNCTNSLGDYGAIGRGCADPTGKLSKSQSGITPIMFMKNIPFVKAKKINENIKNAAINLALYENLDSHCRAIEG